MLATLSQPGATHDEWFHASSIWCGQGVREPYCRDIVDNGVDVPYALTNIDARNCGADQDRPLLCPTSRSNETALWTNTGLYPPLFYFVLSWVVIPSVDVSILLARVASALLISVVLAVMAVLLPSRHRLVLFLVSLTTFTGSGYFLFASINPSSWTVFGVGVGWLAVHAAVATGDLSKVRRVQLGAIGMIAWLMAVGSRWDAPGFVAFSLALLAFHVIWCRFPRYRKTFLPAALLTVFLLLLVLERLTPLSPLYHLEILIRYTNGQPDNTAFFTYNFLQGLPNALRALGTLPTLTTVTLPDVVFVAAIALLACFMFVTYHRRQPFQVIGLALSSCVIALVIMAQVTVNDVRDVGGVEPRYVYPVLVFAVGWWFLLAPSDFASRVSKYLKPASLVSVGLFALTILTVAERYVDRQTFGLRYLPESLDQWWWTWMPIGPNVVAVLAPLCVWMFFQGFVRHGLLDSSCTTVHKLPL